MDRFIGVFNGFQCRYIYRLLAGWLKRRGNQGCIGERHAVLENAQRRLCYLSASDDNGLARISRDLEELFTGIVSNAINN